MDAPVSVIIPCYRCRKTIDRAIHSVVKQTFRPAEIILIDDESGDETLAHLYKLQSLYGQNWLKIIALENNQGPSFCRNLGWDQASQDYIAFLDADDLWHPQKIELQYQWLKQHPEIAGCGHYLSLLEDVEPQFNPLSQNLSAHLISQRKILLTNPLLTSSWMLLKEIPLRFDTTRKHCEDHHLLIHLILDNYRLAYLDIPAVFYDNKTEGLSANRWQMRKSQLQIYYQLLQQKKINLLTYLICSLYSLIKFGVSLLLPKIHLLLSSKMPKLSY